MSYKNPIRRRNIHFIDILNFVANQIYSSCLTRNYIRSAVDYAVLLSPLYNRTSLRAGENPALFFMFFFMIFLEFVKQQQIS
jgi:hypothetical protein